MTKATKVLLLKNILFVVVHNNMARSASGVKRMCFDGRPFLGRSTIGPSFDLLSSVNGSRSFTSRFGFFSRRGQTTLFSKLCPAASKSDVVRILGAGHPGVLVVLVRNFKNTFMRPLNNLPSIAPRFGHLSGRKIFFAGYCTGDFHASHKAIYAFDNCLKLPATSMVGVPTGDHALPTVTRKLSGTNCGASFLCKNSVGFAGVGDCLLDANCRHLATGASFSLTRRADGT